jgi:hypothetical protein
VRDRVAQACQQVHRLRTGLHDIDRKTVMGMIRIPRLAQRKVRDRDEAVGGREGGRELIHLNATLLVTQDNPSPM